MGYVTPSLMTALASGVRSGWHGPGNIDPVNPAAQGHVDLTKSNFGIQEDVDLGWGEIIQEVFPGCQRMKKGYMYLNAAPGIGVDIDEKLAAKYPLKPFPAGTGFRFPIRKADGTLIGPEAQAEECSSTSCACATFTRNADLVPKFGYEILRDHIYQTASEHDSILTLLHHCFSVLPTPSHNTGSRACAILELGGGEQES